MPAHETSPQNYAVFQGFLAYWRGYLDAINSGKTDTLQAGASGDALKAVLDGLAKISQFGWRYTVEVVNQPPPVIQMADQNAAVVADTTTTREQLVDGKGRVLNNSEHTAPFMRELHVQDGAWKVTRVWAIETPAEPGASTSAAPSGAAGPSR